MPILSAVEMDRLCNTAPRSCAALTAAGFKVNVLMTFVQDDNASLEVLMSSTAALAARHCRRRRDCMAAVVMAIASRSRGETGLCTRMAVTGGPHVGRQSRRDHCHIRGEL